MTEYNASDKFIIIPFSGDSILKSVFDSLCISHDKTLSPSENLKLYGTDDQRRFFRNSTYSIMLFERFDTKVNDRIIGVYRFWISLPDKDLNEHYCWNILYTAEIGPIYLYENYNADPLADKTIYKLISKTNVNQELIDSLLNNLKVTRPVCH